MNRELFPPPLPLADLVAASGVDGVHDLALAADAIEIAPKANQIWRVTLLGQVVIGYERSAVVAGRDALAMDVVAARLRALASPDDAAFQSRYQVLDLALTVREMIARSARANLDQFTPRYLQVLAHVVDMDDTEQNALLRELHAVAPEAAQQLLLALAVYEMGLQDGLDLAAPDTPDDYIAPAAPTGHSTIVKSA